MRAGERWWLVWQWTLDRTSIIIVACFVRKEEEEEEDMVNPRYDGEYQRRLKVSVKVKVKVEIHSLGTELICSCRRE